MEAIEIIQHDFDNMENIHGEGSKSFGVFVADGTGRTAHGIAVDFLRKLPAQEHYLCHNGQVYPMFEAKDIELNQFTKRN